MSTQYVCMHFSHMLKHVWTCWFWTCWYVLWNLWINLQYSAHLLKKNSAPRTRASQHLRGWRAVGRLWHSNARNACPWPGWPGWPRQWKVGLSQCLCVSSSYSSYSSYNLHVRHKVGFFLIFMILLILSILRSWVIFKIRGRQAPVATFLCFFFVFFSRSLDFLPSAFCPLCSLVMIIMFPFLTCFFPFSFSVRAHTDTRIGLMHRSLAGCPPCTEMLGYAVQSQDIAMSSNERQKPDHNTGSIS